MVEVRDVTEERHAKRKRRELEEKLAKECFDGRKIDIIGDLITIDNGKAFKYIGTILMYVKNADIFAEAQEFGKRYEEQFHEGKNVFIIETDYSYLLR